VYVVGVAETRRSPRIPSGGNKALSRWLTLTSNDTAIIKTGLQATG
jgi:hypothetical protein